MNAIEQFEPSLWKVLQRGKLADLSQYHRDGAYDEVPLFHRLSDVSFLPESDRRNEILLRFSLKLLRSIISYQEHRTPYFAAVTIWNNQDDTLIPNVFFWSKDIQELYHALKLGEIRSRFGTSVKKLLSKIDSPEPLEIAEEEATTSGVQRVFIGPSIRPYRNFVPLHALQETASLVDRRALAQRR